MTERSEIGRLIGITDARGNLVPLGPNMPPATSSVRLLDGVPVDQNGARVITTVAHMSLFDRRNVAEMERRRLSTVPPGTTVWRSPVRGNKSV